MNVNISLNIICKYISKYKISPKNTCGKHIDIKSREGFKNRYSIYLRQVSIAIVFQFVIQYLFLC